MHTDPSLEIFDDSTVHLGNGFRTFKEKTCPAFDTHELSRETEARGRQQTGNRDEKGPQRKQFSLQTYKFHALGDYPAMIRHFGTSDSYSTQPVGNYYL
jgi:hypothetical protein